MTEQEKHLIAATKRRKWMYGRPPSLVAYEKVIAAMNSYAAAQVANVKTNDANKAIQACAQFSCAVVAAKDAEIAELARKLEMQDTMHANTEAVLTEEIKRLREGIRKALKYIEGPHHSGPEPIAIYEILQPLISPSDGDGVEKNKCQNCSNGQCSNPPSYAVCYNTSMKSNGH